MYQFPTKKNVTNGDGDKQNHHNLFISSENSTSFRLLGTTACFFNLTLSSLCVGQVTFMNNQLRRQSISSFRFINVSTSAPVSSLKAVCIVTSSSDMVTPTAVIVVTDVVSSDMIEASDRVT